MESSAGKPLPTRQEAVKTPYCPLALSVSFGECLKGPGRSIEVFEQVGGFQPKSKGHGLERSQADLLFTDLKV